MAVKMEVMQLALWGVAEKQMWSVQLDSYNSHDVWGNNLSMGYFSLHTNNPYSERCDHCISSTAYYY